MIGDLTMKLLCRTLPVALGGLIVVSCGATGSSTAATTTAPPVKPSDAAVQIIANGCSQVEVHGAGLMVAPGKVATVAHVIAGAKDIEVRATGGTSEATVVYFDPILDVAVLKVDPEIAPSIPIGDASPGAQGSVIVYRDDAPTELLAGVQRLVNIRTADIYGEGKHLRPGYELTLDIHAGDSGAVVVIDDQAVALVWATSRQAEARAWAMRTSLIADHLTTDAPVDNGECV
jgi:S1-C subfamily serine protease